MELLDILQETTSVTSLEDVKIFNLSLIDFWDFGKLLFRLVFTVGVLYLLIRCIYDKGSTGRHEFIFTYFALGVSIFLLCFLLEDVKLELGFALGLFAVFGILKYRTDPIPIREMTYLFVVIGIAVVNALANKKVSFAELFLTNGAILLCVWMLENWLFKNEGHIDIIYERIEKIRTEDRPALIEDVEKRTGLKVKRVDFTRIDFLKDVAYLRVYYVKEKRDENVIESKSTESNTEAKEADKK
ncbi:MAG: DUF4956 domain-containing protein [Bacteroidales bacterium]|nr:DUF4956 domain-containing protein [Bacteroidales bacterium]